MCKPRLKAAAQVLELVLNARPSSSHVAFAPDIGRSCLDWRLPKSGHLIVTLIATASCPIAAS
jgi:hypothetical protein